MEEEGTLRCTRCGIEAPLTGAYILADKECSATSSTLNSKRCQACGRPAVQKLPLINFRGEFEDFNACEKCSEDYLRLLRGPPLGHGKGRIPPNSYYIDGLKTVFQQLGGVFPCPACEEFYEDLYGVVQHFSQKHRELLQEPKDDEIEGVPAVKTWQFLWCKKCLKYFENERHFRSHIQFCKGDRK